MYNDSRESLGFDPPPPNVSERRSTLTRRAWLAAAPGTAMLAGAGPSLAFGQAARSDSEGNVHSEFPSHDPAVVREVVAVSHMNIDRLRQLVEASPALAKAAWDWGFGDWESALGAASHMGRRDIAELLISHGARPDLFTFAMFGHLEVVKAYIKAMPGIQRTPGPHGITLLKHARNGGKQAQSVAEYLESVGGADSGAPSLELSEEQKQQYLGRYSFGAGDNDAFDVIKNRRGVLAIKRGARFARTLNRVEEHAFAPAGASAVRIRFEIKDGRAVSLTVHDPEPLVKARRSD